MLADVVVVVGAISAVGAEAVVVTLFLLALVLVVLWGCPSKDVCLSKVPKMPKLWWYPSHFFLSKLSNLLICLALILLCLCSFIFLIRRMHSSISWSWSWIRFLSLVLHSDLWFSYLYRILWMSLTLSYKSWFFFCFMDDLITFSGIEGVLQFTANWGYSHCYVRQWSVCFMFLLFV